MAERKLAETKGKETTVSTKNDRPGDKYFEKFFHLFLNYISKMYIDQSSLFKAILITDGTCIENISNLNQCLDTNRFFLSCDILLTTNPDNCVSNGFGFVFSEPLLASIAKTLNGKIYSIDEFEELMNLPLVSVYNGSLEVDKFFQLLLGINQRITYFYQIPFCILSV